MRCRRSSATWVASSGSYTTSLRATIQTMDREGGKPGRWRGRQEQSRRKLEVHDSEEDAAGIGAYIVFF